MNIKKVYESATGVDINEQKLLWDERGKGYYGEFLVFKELYLGITGNYKFLFNVEIPNINGTKTTEIDAILIHETGIYCMEIKHYKGIIYGKYEDQYWTQFFKTTDNNRFENPIKQNEWHIAAIRKFFPDSNISSYIVFTNTECDLKITGNKMNTTVCYLQELKHDLNKEISNKPNRYSLQQIEAMFQRLKPFSKISNETVKIFDEIVPFIDYINKIKENNDAIVNEKIDELAAADKKRKGINVLCIIIALLSIVGGTYAAMILPQSRINTVEAKYQDFFQKFEVAKDITIEDISVQNLVKVKDLIIENNPDLEDGINISFSLGNTGENYHIGLSKDTSLIIQTIDGKVIEASIYASDLYGLQQTNAFLYRIQPEYYASLNTGVITVQNIKKEEISYVKLINLCVYKNNEYNALAEKTEITIFE